MKEIKDLQKWLIGKTVAAVDNESCNCLTITFTDGTVLCLDTEAQGLGIYGPVPYEVQPGESH